MAHPRSNATRHQSFLRSQSVKATAISSADVVSVPAGAAGTLKNFALAYHPICNAGGTDIGGEGDTSIAISAGDVFTTQVGFKDDADLANGEFWVDHLTGKGRGRKATTNTTITLTYNIFVVQTSNTTTVTVDSEFPAAAAAADADANPTTTSVKSYMMGFNGATWDRLRTAVVAVTSTLTGFLNTLPWAVFHTTPSTRTNNQGGPLEANAQGALRAVPSDGTNDVTIETAGADAQNNTTNSLTVRARQYGFNGTTWDRIRTAVTTVSATLTGFLNTLPWAIYNATPTTRTEGQGGPLQADTKGNLHSNLNTLLSGENQGKNRLMTTRPGTSTRITTATTTTPVSGTGILAKIIVEVALTGTVTVYDNTAASGTVLAILPIGTVAGVYMFDSKFTTGLTLVTSAADRIIVVADDN